MSAPSVRSHPLRAALLGLALACFLGGLYLLGAAAWGLFHPFPCVGLGPRECGLQQEARHELARYQAAAGSGFSLLGVALGTLLRKRNFERSANG